jgi:hypothetical protein
LSRHRNQQTRFCNPISEKGDTRVAVIAARFALLYIQYCGNESNLIGGVGVQVPKPIPGNVF